MKLSEAANWAEIVSATGLVISLIYVGIQVTDNTSAMRSETASNASTEFIDWYTHVSADPELMDVWLRGVTAPETLDEQRGDLPIGGVGGAPSEVGFGYTSRQTLPNETPT